jgi:hypothetical protein
VIPRGPFGFLTAWPSGAPRPLAATLNALTGAITANAAIIPAGANGAIAVYASDTADLVVDVSGYFALPGPSALSFYPITPCRVVDTRWAAVPVFGTPALGSAARDFPISSGSCQVPAAPVYALNATVVPAAPVGYLTLWPAGTAQPAAATLNALDQAVTSNAAFLSATNGAVSACASGTTELILDLNGYFAP